MAARQKLSIRNEPLSMRPTHWSIGMKRLDGQIDAAIAADAEFMWSELKEEEREPSEGI
jgi:hypothetical protein